jgi:hypothetical protein
MTRIVVAGALALALASSSGCAGPPPQLTWVHLGQGSALPRAPALPLYFTRQAVPPDLVAVARYQVRTRGNDLRRAMHALVRRAAADGSDAVLLERADGAAVTVWSWLLLLIPLKEHTVVLHAVGLRRTGGA